LGGRTSLVLKESPELLMKFENAIQIKPKLVHVIRNPFDVISTCTLRMSKKKGLKGKPSSIDILPFIKGFFDRTELVNRLKSEKE